MLFLCVIQMDLKNKVAYITGGSKGIGLGVAKCLLEEGMKVVISGRNEAALEDARKTLGMRDELMTIVSDVTKLEDEEEVDEERQLLVSDCYLGKVSAFSAATNLVTLFLRSDLTVQLHA